MAASPTLRRRRLARQLLRLREEARMTAKAAATRAKELSPDRPWFESKITRIETQKILKVRDADVQTLLDVYGVDDPEQREAYRTLARDATKTGWWIGYRDVLGAGTLVDLETEASRIRTVQGFYIPGLLQTESYARAVVRSGGYSEEEVARRVEARMMRQHILSRSDAPRLWAIIDEAAFWKIPPDLLEEQIRHLIDVQRPSLRIQVMPNSVGPHPAMDGSFVIIDFATDPSALYLEHPMSTLFPEDPRVLEHFEMTYDHVHASAMSVGDSLAWMQSLLQTRE
ncbi:helix-turn-helix domain-containing protein [Nocardiopsis sediminis]|uniref:Helix-turn-helix domain-containing protein n=1 Tax=Nocardiopsis sediminis TaxID=1778267 RepID=A0ABV8FFC7_9ACTN